MKNLSNGILERDAKRDIGAEVLEAIREIKAGGLTQAHGAREPGH